jgi:hypothetical protein
LESIDSTRPAFAGFWDAVKAILDLEEAGEKVWEVGRLVERARADGAAYVVHNCAKAWQ